MKKNDITPQEGVFLALILAMLALAMILVLFLPQAKGVSPPKDKPLGLSEDPSPAPSGAQDGSDWAYTFLELGSEDLAQGSLVLVNALHPYDDAAARVVSVYDYKTAGYFVKDRLVCVCELAMFPLNDFLGDFARQTGREDLNVVAGHRSFDDQQAIYDSAVAEKGQDHADAYIALPGYSEHHTGLAVDLDTYDPGTGLSYGFTGEGPYRWLSEHAGEYGFVLRYPADKQDVTGIAYEAWHFRYVGVPHAACMAEQDLCLEEYLTFLRAFPFEGEHLLLSFQGQRYEIYFCQGLRAAVPTELPYTLSGNNEDGFIVTVELGQAPR